MLDDLDMCCVDVLVRICEMNGENGSKELWWIHRVLLCHNICRLFHGIRGYNDTVVGFCIARHRVN